MMHAAIGFELLEGDQDGAHGRFTVTDVVRQPMMGIVHGGAYATAAETLASMVTHDVVSRDDMVAFGHSNHTSFLRPVSDGTVHAEGRVRHRGRTSWVWDVDFTDDEGRLCALSRITLAVRSAERP
jgi:1,4-dihydroxy-2-naphthoyl-CoA hydrolase